jgi:hypothetical protein
MQVSPPFVVVFFFFFFLSSTALGGLWLPSQLAAMYFVPVLSLSL